MTHTPKTIQIFLPGGAFSPTNQRFRRRLFESGVMQEDADRVVFLKDHLFGSPSMAVALLGRTSNGWKESKNKDGVTLDELKRPAEAGEA